MNHCSHASTKMVSAREISCFRGCLSVRVNPLLHDAGFHARFRLDGQTGKLEMLDFTGSRHFVAEIKKVIAEVNMTALVSGCLVGSIPLL